MNIAVLIGEIAYISRDRVLEGIRDAAKKDGSNIILFTCEGFLFHDLDKYSYGEYKIFELPSLDQYDGIIVNLDSIENPKMQEYLRENIINSNVPCVSFNRELGDANVICFDNKPGFEALVRHVVEEHKLKDIHFISGHFGNPDAIERLDVFKKVMAENNIPVNEEDIYEGDFNFASGKKIAQIYISGERKLPEAFIAANDFMAIGLMEELRKGGIRVPEDVIVVGYDNREIVKYTTPKLTTVDSGDYDAGVLAYEELKAGIGEAHQGKKINVEGKLKVNCSCGCNSNDTLGGSANQSVVDLKMHMDESLDIIKSFYIHFAAVGDSDDYMEILHQYVDAIGMDYFYFCQCGTRQSYYEELEVLASGKKIKRNITKYQDIVWCPMAYEEGELTTYPPFGKRLLFPKYSKRRKDGGYYIVMPVHQGDVCIGYCIMGNLKTTLSGRVLQHFVVAIEETLGNKRNNDIMKTMLARINQQWKYDELTGLLNRSGLIQNVEKIIESADADGDGICVMFFDLDGLKTVNDSKGHKAGDSYIKQMADILTNNTDDEDLVCRYGGDEYVVISRAKNEEESRAKFERIQSAILSPVECSCGMEFDRISSEKELTHLIETADQKMYEDKKGKKKAR